MRGILETNVYESKIALTPALSRGERGFFGNLLDPVQALHVPAIAMARPGFNRFGGIRRQRWQTTSARKRE